MQGIKAPTDVDKLVGSNIRRIRILRGLAQKALAEALGVTFQQVQKYENGANRMSAGRLVHLAEVMDCSIIDLFQGVETPKEARFETFSKNAISAAIFFDAIDDEGQRHALLLLLSSLAGRSIALPQPSSAENND